MTISFDLDDTIIPGTKRFETERQTIIIKYLEQKESDLEQLPCLENYETEGIKFISIQLLSVLLQRLN